MLHAEVGGHGPRLVLAHGFTQTGRSWSTIADDLARDHQVVTVDLPGHGRSAAIRADLAAGARLLGAAGGPATYLGYSLGARFCLSLSLRRPDLVTRLVLVSGTAGIDDADERAARRRADAARAEELERHGVDAFLERWLALPMFARLPPAERTGAGRQDRVTNTSAGLASSLRLAGTGTLDPSLWNRLGELTLPVLVLAGEADAKFVTLARRLAAEIGASATLAVVPGAGHAAHLEQPDAFLAAVRPWMVDTGPVQR